MVESYFKKSQQTWDTIADSFDITRRKPWNQCIDFINKLPTNYTVADIGCGNGRHLLPCAKHCKKAVGIDISRNLINIVKRKIYERCLNNVSLIHANMINLPIEDNTIDAVVCIASVHNIKGKNNRISALNEIFRILKKNRTAIISVWSRWQDRFRNYYLKRFFSTEGEFGDIYIPWKQHNINIPRFYHLYSKREFIRDINQANLKIEKIISEKLHSSYTADNFFATVRKE